MSLHSPMSFPKPLSPGEVDTLLKNLALKAFDLHASSAWGSQEGFSLNLAVAIADQLVEERDQREKLLTLLADQKFGKHVKLSSHPRPACESADKWGAFIWTSDIWEPGADQEYFTLPDVPTLAYLWDTYGYTGLLAWVGFKRGEEPSSFLYRTTEETRNAYSEAENYLKSKAADSIVSRVRIA